MVDKITFILALCITGAVLCRVTGKYSKEQSVMLAITVCTAVMMYVLLHVSPALSLTERLCSLCNLDEKYTVILFKSVGICYITQFACDVCKDCGENAIATAAEISGKTAILLLSVPLTEDLLGYVQKLT